MKKELLCWILLLIAPAAFSQTVLFKNSVAEVKLTDADNWKSLFTNRAILSYNQSTGELRCTLNIAVLSEQRYGLPDNTMDLDAFMPGDSSLIYFTATLARDVLTPSGTPMDGATQHMPGYFVYQGIQQAVIADWSYGSSMNQNQQKIYLNLYFRVPNDESNLVRFSQVNFVPAEIQVDIVDGFVNLVN
jgi:hypothetical protein